jgi:hypothetical protein
MKQCRIKYVIRRTKHTLVLKTAEKNAVKRKKLAHYTVHNLAGMYANEYLLVNFANVTQTDCYSTQIGEMHLKLAGINE